jgi:hypothetical protein
MTVECEKALRGTHGTHDELQPAIMKWNGRSCGRRVARATGPAE